MRGYGTKFVWNSFRSTFNDPSNRSEAVMEDTTEHFRQQLVRGGCRISLDGMYENEFICLYDHKLVF